MTGYAYKIHWFKLVMFFNRFIYQFHEMIDCFSYFFFLHD